MAHLNESHYNADKLLLQPLEHLSQKGPERNNLLGRMWRSFNFWFDSPKNDRQIMAGILDDVLSLSYLMDDITDMAVLRRGLPTAHHVFGVAQTVYGTVYAAFCIPEKFLYYDEHKEKLIDSYIEICIQTTLNEIMIVHFRDNLICPTDEEYIRYFGFTYWVPFSAQTMQLTGKNNHLPNVNRALEENIALFIAVYNDYINLRSIKYSKLRVPCDDVSEGKFSYLVIYAVKTHPEDHRLLDILKKRPTDAESKKRFVSILEDFGAFEFAKKTLEDLRDEIVQEGEKLYQRRNPYMEKFLDDVLKNLETDDEVYFDVCMEDE